MCGHDQQEAAGTNQVPESPVLSTPKTEQPANQPVVLFSTTAWLTRIFEAIGVS